MRHAVGDARRDAARHAMGHDGSNALNRRAFLLGSAAAGIGSLGVGARPAAAQPALETTRIRLVHDPSICVSPQYVAEDLLRADGFTQVDYVEAKDGSGAKLIAAGQAD